VFETLKAKGVLKLDDDYSPISSKAG
jgi:hypothetical protein